MLIVFRKEFCTTPAQRMQCLVARSSGLAALLINYTRPVNDTLILMQSVKTPTKCFLDKLTIKSMKFAGISISVAASFFRHVWRLITLRLKK